MERAILIDFYYARLVYNKNGGTGSVPETQQAAFDHEFAANTFTIGTTKPTPPSGKKFDGWSTNKNALNADYSNPAKSYTEKTIAVRGGDHETPINTVTLYAIYLNTTQYTAILKYSPNGGDSGSAPAHHTSSSNSPGQSVTFTIKSGTPTRTGYTFKGWSKSKTATTASYVAGDTYTMKTGTASDPENTDWLYAVWKKKTYTVTYKPGSHSSGSDYTDTKTYGETLQLRGSTYTRSGYTQDGWSTTDGGSKAYDLKGSYTSNASITLYPHWSTSNYTITYKKGTYGAGSDQTQTKPSGSSVILYNAGYFTRSGYTQTGWSTKSNGSTNDYALGATYSTNASITLYPYWSAQAYTITYNANGGSGNDYTQNVAFGEVWHTYSGSGFSKPGYRLIGYALSPTGGVTYSLDRDQPAWWRTYNLTVYCVWEVQSIVHVKVGDAIKTGVVYVKTDSGMKLGIVYVKGNDGNMHQNT